MVLKFKKYHKARVKLSSISRLNNLSYGIYGIKVLSSIRLKSVQIESLRRVLKKVLKKNALIWQMYDVNIPVSRKPAEVRMGGGKGSIDGQVCLLRAGSILFEIGGDLLTPKLAKFAFDQVSYRLPIKIELVKRLF